MKHFDVALAFVKGNAAHNARMSTDGQSVFADGRVIATKTDDGVVILATYRTRSGSIMRSAVERAAYQAKQYAKVRASNGLFPVSRDELLKLWQEENADRAAVGMSPLVFSGLGGR